MNRSLQTNSQSEKKPIVREAVIARLSDIASMLPKSMPSDKFARIFDSALLRTPDLLKCTPASVLEAVSKCAADGLVPDGREAALVVTKGRIKDGNQWRDARPGEWTAQYWPMVAGMLKRARNSGEISSLMSSIVYEEEWKQNRFTYVNGTLPAIHHDPILVGDRGKPVAAYSVCRMRDGSIDIEVMRWDEIMSIAKRAKSTKQDGTLTGPWASDPGEMARKTVLRRHMKRLPMDSDLARLFQNVDDLYDAQSLAGGPPQRTLGPAAQRLAALKAPAHDPDTGEVHEEEAAAPAQPRQDGRKAAGKGNDTSRQEAPAGEALDGEIEGPDDEEDEPLS